MEAFSDKVQGSCLGNSLVTGTERGHEHTKMQIDIFGI